MAGVRSSPVLPGFGISISPWRCFDGSLPLFSDLQGVSVTWVEPSAPCAAGPREDAGAESMSWGRRASGESPGRAPRVLLGWKTHGVLAVPTVLVRRREGRGGCTVLGDLDTGQWAQLKQEVKLP